MTIATEMTWVKCRKCNQSYEMSLKEYFKEQEEKARANPSPMPIALPLKCQKCGQDGITKAFKCENPQCGEVFFANSVPADFEDRCPKCKNSATEAKRKARLGQAQQPTRIGSEPVDGSRQSTTTAPGTPDSMQQ
jgi:hypothetical protein